MLEFFATGTRGAEEVVALAFSSAHVRRRENVSDLISRLYLRNSREKPTAASLDRIRFTPGLRLGAPKMEDDVRSPMSPLLQPLRSSTAPPQLLGRVPPPSGLELQIVSAPPKPFCFANIHKFLSESCSFPHVESPGSLGSLREATLVGFLGRGATASPGDSGFAEGVAFTSGPPGNFNNFGSGDGRIPWHSGFGLLGVGS
ncbi:hypothetical protein VTH06DRAFT_5366 [Thermothelomyces fergusii]